MRKGSILFVRYVPVLLFLSSLFSSCKKNAVTSENVDVNKGDRVYEYIQKLGYHDSEIKDIGDKYLVDGDILFDKNSNPDFSIFGGPRTEQYGAANYVGIDYQPNIIVKRHTSLPSSFTIDVQNAINLLNSVPNCRVKFQDAQTTPNTPNIVIWNSLDLLPECGASHFPINGKPGNRVFINVTQVAGYSPEQRQRTIAHELLHSIGLRHTNWQGLEGQSGTDIDNGAYYDAMHLLGTPTGGDPSSIMNGGQCGTGATTLSPFDIIALQFLYPAAPTVPGAIPIYRYFGRVPNGDHFYTTKLTDLQNGTNTGYIFEGIGMFAFINQIDNTIPVYRYYRTQGQDHYYTTNPLDIPANSANEGIVFYVYPSAINGAVPVYRYYNSTTDDHFYTKDQDEVAFMPGYVSEGIVWYAH